MKRSQNIAAPHVLRASKRANLLIEAMLKEMQRGIRDPQRFESTEWERLFGNKQSMVVNLQKLVQALAVLPSALSCETSKPIQNGALSAQEMELLAEWLKQGTTNG